MCVRSCHLVLQLWVQSRQCKRKHLHQTDSFNQNLFSASCHDNFVKRPTRQPLDGAHCDTSEVRASRQALGGGSPPNSSNETHLRRHRELRRRDSSETIHGPRPALIAQQSLLSLGRSAVSNSLTSKCIASSNKGIATSSFSILVVMPLLLLVARRKTLPSLDAAHPREEVDWGQGLCCKSCVALPQLSELWPEVIEQNPLSY